MGEMGISLSVPDYRLIFDKIDFDKEEEIDYFKFCLLDYEKEAMRLSLSKQFNLNQEINKNKIS